MAVLAPVATAAGLYQGVENRKNRHTGESRYQKAVDFDETNALDIGLRLGDGAFFNTLLPRQVGLMKNTRPSLLALCRFEWNLTS